MTHWPLCNHLALGVLCQEVDNGAPALLISILERGHKARFMSQV